MKRLQIVSAMTAMVLGNIGSAQVPVAGSENAPSTVTMLRGDAIGLTDATYVFYQMIAARDRRSPGGAQQFLRATFNLDESTAKAFWSHIVSFLDDTAWQNQEQARIICANRGAFTSTTVLAAAYEQFDRNLLAYRERLAKSSEAFLGAENKRNVERHIMEFRGGMAIGKTNYLLAMDSSGRTPSSIVASVCDSSANASRVSK